ncbi:MAG: 23S rRNA (adenine(2503)-C(2))-methyltransferase RlmN [Firmicutes bacterium]|nr:23S rRNA (adenine(2503)-C(2))-methyltransferase RlmN [Bacillota bacterium]
MRFDGLELAGLFPEEIAERLKLRRFEAFRAEQIFHWLQGRAVLEFEEMANIPNKLIRLLKKELASPLSLEAVKIRTSRDGTEKYLFQLEDGHTIETVLIPETQRQTVCLSSQVGCAMDCSFCATGRAGFIRNLSAGEIVSQILWVENRLRKKKLTITNVVLMGMGEPLANYDSVLKSIRLLNHPSGRNLGARRFTVSTCGLVPGILALAREDLQVNLAVSLHGADDKIRSELMPVNQRFPLAKLLEACAFYFEQTGRRISFEYALILDFNDSLKHARQLRDLLRGLASHVNLIPVNPVEGYKRPDQDRIRSFQEILDQGGVSVSIRKERGTDIEAACGQLRQRVFSPQFL